MADAWDVPDDETNMGEKTFSVETGGERPGIYVHRTCGGTDKKELLIPKEILIKACSEFISCVNKTY